jgi:hypothetical protein
VHRLSGLCPELPGKRLEDKRHVPGMGVQASGGTHHGRGNQPEEKPDLSIAGRFPFSTMKEKSMRHPLFFTPLI